MSQAPTKQERREFFRINFKTPLQFKSYALDDTTGKARPTETVSAKSENISQSGILFQTDGNPPQLSSIIWMNLDIRTLNICKEIESRALVFQNGLLGRVVRVEEDSDAYDIGVCFLTQEQKNSREIQRILSDISQKS